MMGKLVTVKELSKRYGVHKETVRRWMKQGTIPYVRPTLRTVRFDLEAVDRALNHPVRKMRKRK
jgi:excisionase family DNA binding protein